MKRLTTIRLVNWHAFIDETIHINNSAMISGENGAGKSTILDAVQFVLTCSKNNFNKAANEKSKRNLIGYVRYKTGKENNEYERSGNVSSHVALEFYEESKKKYFIIGAVIDSASETSEKVLWYRIENKRIEDISFICDENPRDISNFKVYAKEFKIQSFLEQPTNAKNDFANRLGKLNSKYFELLPKALAFRPISNVKDFVYTYILQERDVNIEDLRQNIKTYKEFEDLINVVKLQITKLKDIKEQYSIYQNHLRTEKIHELIIILAEEELLKKSIKENIERINSLEVQINSLESNIKIKNDEFKSLNELHNKLYIELNSNSDYRAVNGVKEKLETEKSKYQQEHDECRKFIKFVRSQSNSIKQLAEVCVENEELRNYYNVMVDVNVDNLEEYKALTKNVELVINKIKSSNEEIRASKKYEKDKKNELKKEYEKKISELEKKNLQYKWEVTYLIEGIKTESRKLGKLIEPKILCELLEITDNTWKNAVEGYLNSQRFYLLVDEEDFDMALKIYERLSKSQKIHSVGIINAKGLEKYDEPLENSLAEVVISKSSVAKRYINMILGKVIRCKDVSELKNYKTSITSTCMLYKNNVARALDPKVYKTPYIGAEAYKEQLRQAKEEREELMSAIKVLNDEYNEADKKITIIDKIKIESLENNCDVIKNEAVLLERVNKLQEHINELEKNGTYMDIEIKIQKIKEDIEKNSAAKKELENQIIQKTSTLKVENQNRDKYKADLSNKVHYKGEYMKQVDSPEDAVKKFDVEKNNKSLSEIRNNYEFSRRRQETMAKNAEDKLKELQTLYNNTYEFGAEVGINGVEKFFEQLNILEKSKMVEYEESLKNSKKNAEEEFKGHFLAKIQENISMARREIRLLNSGLNNITFGNEHYAFKVGKSKENKEYYDMIMDDENIGEGYTLFSSSFESKHKELLNELFEKLTMDDENTDKELLRLTDYRNYMSYDIEIKYDDGSSALFSKVCSEKSGGETQTPYYVAMASSFIQLYKGSALSTESIGLILFDEAFDKMDDSRIIAMMKFYKNLKDLQLIIAAPPQKIEVIAPYVNSVIIALKDEKASYVENLFNEKDEI